MYLLRHFCYVIDIITWQTKVKVYLFRIYLSEEKKLEDLEKLYGYSENIYGFRWRKNEDDSKPLLTAIT